LKGEIHLAVDHVWLRKEFPIFSLTRQFVLNLGFERKFIAKLTDEEMEEIARIVGTADLDLLERVQIVVQAFIDIHR